MMVNIFVLNVGKSFLNTKTSVGNVEHISLIIVMKLKCGGVVVKKEKKHQVVSLISMSVKMIVMIQMTWKKNKK